MAAIKRSKAQLLADRAETARLYLQGRTQRSIAAAMGVTPQQICFDMKAIYRQWIESAVIDFNALQARELARLDAMEAECWDRHRASIGEHAVRTARRITGEKAREESGRRAEDMNGDPRWMGLILQCVAQRARILGIEKQQQVTSALRVLVVHPQQLEADEWAAQFGGRVIEHQAAGGA